MKTINKGAKCRLISIMQTLKKTNKDSIRLLIGNFNDYTLRYKYLIEQIKEKAFFFAEPYIAGDIILWRTPLKGKIVAYKNLSKQEQDNTILQFEKLLNELINKLQQNNKLNHKNENYFIIPSQSDIYVIENDLNKTIIITQWGSEPDDGKQQAINIKTFFEENIIKQKEEIKKRRIEIPPPQPIYEKVEEFIIPDKPKDFKFAMGKWKSTSNLQNSRTNEAVELFFEFDITGKGTITMLEAGGNKCIGPLQLRLEQKTLHIEQLDVAKCDDNQNYVKHNIKCISDDNNIARCIAETNDGNKIIEFNLEHES